MFSERWKILIKRISIPFSFVLIGILAWWIFHQKSNLSTETTLDQVKRKNTISRIASNPTRETVDHPAVESLADFQTANSNPERDLEIIQGVIENYRRLFGGNPIGENEEIFAALLGENPKSIRFLPSEIPGLQDNGILQDRWGTPWRFHAISGHEMEVSSAGPDREFHTADDIDW